MSDPRAEVKEALKVCVVLGTRPEIIKMSPVIRECVRLDLELTVLHSGQHYSYGMDKVFFEQLELPDASYNLEVGSGSHADQTGRILIGIEPVLMKEKPDVVLVEGDTNTVLAGALAAVKLGICVGHVEAGLRSYDWQMPEEINRILTDHCSTLLFAPTERSRNVLLSEGIPAERIFVTGNTIVDGVFQNLEMARRKAKSESSLGLKEKNYFLVTVHRQENVDNKEELTGILEGLNRLCSEYELPVICPVHPRARKQLQMFGLDVGKVRLIEPVDYLTFLLLESQARLVLTDSGGVQEETCVLRIPCVTLRYNTERPETLMVGSNVLAGTHPDTIVEKTEMMMSKPSEWRNPFGDGKAGERTVRILTEEYERGGLHLQSKKALDFLPLVGATAE